MFDILMIGSLDHYRIIEELNNNQDLRRTCCYYVSGECQTNSTEQGLSDETNSKNPSLPAHQDSGDI
jgi:hypothetical protein